MSSPQYKAPRLTYVYPSMQTITQEITGLKLLTEKKKHPNSLLMRKMEELREKHFQEELKAKIASIESETFKVIPRTVFSQGEFHYDTFIPDYTQIMPRTKTD